MSLTLIGFKNCGKTTIGRHLADRLGWSFIDTDERLCAPKTAREYCQEVGEQQFRAQEEALIAQLSITPALIISVGGGAVMNPVSAQVLRQHGPLVYLQCDPEILQQRLQNDMPDFMSGQFHNVYAERKNIYEQLADVTIPVSTRSIEEIAQQIIDGVVTETL